MTDIKKDLIKRYSFIDPNTAREGHIYEILNEIEKAQQAATKDPSLPMADIESLNESRFIKIPFSQTRRKNIQYLLELLVKTYPEEVHQIVSFQFLIERTTKKLSIEQKNEYAVQIKHEDLTAIQHDRDTRSLNSLNDLLASYRLFNLSKLIKRAKNKNQLTRIIKSELGKNIFTFKNYSLDRSQYELVEDFCFHRNNYDAVKDRIDIEGLKKIIDIHSIPINRRLKKFGILNSDFSDYRDTKLDYLLNILLKDLASSLSPGDLVDVKNFHSIRSCLLKVDKLVDPLVSMSNDISKLILETGICPSHDIISIYDNISEEMLDEWSKKNSERYRIIDYTDKNGTRYFVNSKIFIPELSNTMELIVQNQEKLSEMPFSVQKEKQALLDILADLGRNIATLKTPGKAFYSNSEIRDIEDLIKEYDDHKRREMMRDNLRESDLRRERHRSPIKAIIDFFLSFFTRGGHERAEKRTMGGRLANEPVVAGSVKGSTGFSRSTRELYASIQDKKSPLIPLSDYIELIPENEMKVDTLIHEMRENHLKIVIPIYNARKILYPVRSKNLLIPDVEYLLVQPDLIQDADKIREFTDSLAGFKLKDDILSPQGIMAVEKYLLTLHRQKKAQLLRKKKFSR